MAGGASHGASGGDHGLDAAAGSGSVLKRANYNTSGKAITAQMPELTTTPSKPPKMTSRVEWIPDSTRLWVTKNAKNNARLANKALRESSAMKVADAKASAACPETAPPWSALP